MLDGHLCVSRRAGEAILLEVGGTLVRIEFYGIAKGRARVGVRAPREVKILRSEIIERQLAEGLA